MIVSVAGINKVPEYTKAFWELYGSNKSLELMEVLFVPEPTNRYDPKAIKILIDGKQVGYVQRSEQTTIDIQKPEMLTTITLGRVVEFGAVRNNKDQFIYCTVEA